MFAYITPMIKMVSIFRYLNKCINHHVCRLICIKSPTKKLLTKPCNQERM